MYYVYIYTDPRKSGDYSTIHSAINYEPFYVGKGKGNRYTWINSIKSSELHRKTVKENAKELNVNKWNENKEESLEELRSTHCKTYKIYYPNGEEVIVIECLNTVKKMI